MEFKRRAGQRRHLLAQSHMERVLSRQADGVRHGVYLRGGARVYPRVIASNGLQNVLRMGEVTEVAAKGCHPHLVTLM